jgi:hypothetical protein
LTRCGGISQSCDAGFSAARLAGMMIGCIETGVVRFNSASLAELWLETRFKSVPKHI